MPPLKNPKPQDPIPPMGPMGPIGPFEPSSQMEGSFSKVLTKPIEHRSALVTIRAFIREAFLHPGEDSIVDLDTGRTLARGKFTSARPRLDLDAILQQQEPKYRR